jgi:hypothetical protein
MNATDAMHAEQQRREADHLNESLADFMRRFRPDDAYDAHMFETDLIGLIRTAHMQAVEPFARQLGAAMALHPIFPPPLKKQLWTSCISHANLTLLKR